jgi:hypothetical protein
MLRSLKLKRFRGFEKLDATLKPVTVVIGPNSSGKTSVLHAIRMVVEALELALEVGTPQEVGGGAIRVCSNHLIEDFTRLVPVDDWAELFRGGNVAEGSVLEVDAEFDTKSGVSKIRAAIEYGRNRQPKLAVDAWSSDAQAAVAGIPKKSPRRPAVLRDVLAKHAPHALLIPAFYGVTRAEEHRTRGLMLRMLGGGDQSRVVRNLLVRLSTERLAALNTFLGRSLGARITTRTSGDEIERETSLKVYFSDDNGTLELSSAGTGVVNLVALYASIADLRDNEPQTRPIIYLLDEPEAHLHPRLQGDVGAAMAQLALEFGAQVVMATHSVEIVNRVGERPEGLILAVDRSTGRSARLDSQEDVVRELSRWCDLTPFTSINLLASRRVIFHEGQTDGAIIQACARIFLRNRSEEMARVRRWTFQSLDGVGNINARTVLAAVLTPTLFPTLHSGERVRALCVLDRDATRTPGRRTVKELTRPQFEASELVWSRHSIESLFLSPDCLFAWLRVALPVEAADDATLRITVGKAVAAADAAQELEDPAVDALMRAKLNEGEKLSNATAEARKIVRADPATWQRGRSRAHFVLSEVRKSLPSKHQNRVRSSVSDLIDGCADAVQGGPLDQLIPAEIRELFEVMSREE